MYLFEIYKLHLYNKTKASLYNSAINLLSAIYKKS